MEQEGRGGRGNFQRRYFQLIVVPSEDWRSPGERPLIADVQEPHFAEPARLFPDESQSEKCQI